MQGFFLLFLFRDCSEKKMERGLYRENEGRR
jgi:hypothetical protein